MTSESLSGLDLTGTTHTNAGDYPSDTWTFTDATGNYNDASGTVSDSIAKADADHYMGEPGRNHLRHGAERDTVERHVHLGGERIDGDGAGDGHVHATGRDGAQRTRPMGRT